jgi:hypothetical protein
VNRCTFQYVTNLTRRREGIHLQLRGFAPAREAKSSTTEFVKFLIIAAALTVFAACRPIVATEETATTYAPAAAPAYVTDLQAAYGPPSQAAFGSAVFYEAAAQRKDRSALFLLFLLV